nr:MAG TPA: hypothetical protein [Caudoviricetes sp.]
MIDCLKFVSALALRKSFFIFKKIYFIENFYE